MKRISSRDNTIFRAALGLADSARFRREQGRTLIDGEHLVEEALAAGLAPVQLVFSDRAAAMDAWLARLPDVPAVLLSEGLFASLSPVATPSGVLAVIDIPKAPEGPGGDCAVLLEDIQDPGNLGALVRTAAAAGVSDLYLSRGCADAWSPKALRGGQGGHFRLAIHADCDLVDVARGRTGPTYAAALRRQDELYALDLTGPVAFAFGNEGAGLSAALMAASRPFSIPMADAVESLNVAAAAAVCLFERMRQARYGSRPS